MPESLRSVGLGRPDADMDILSTGSNVAMQGRLAVGKHDDNQGKTSGNSAMNPMPPQAVDAVGRKLKATYDEMLREPIPEKLLQLLDDLDQTKEGTPAGDVSADDTRGSDAADKGEE